MVRLFPRYALCASRYAASRTGSVPSACLSEAPKVSNSRCRAVPVRIARAIRRAGAGSAKAYTAAKSAAAVTAMNNVFYRTRHLLSDPEYGTLRAGLRMNVIGNPGVQKADFELWSLAVSAINGCGMCLDSHEQVLRKAGVDRETVQEAFKIASVLQAVGATLDAEAVLAG